MTGYNAVIAAPFGKLGICANAEAVVGTAFLPSNTRIMPPTNKIAKLAAAQLQAFFSNPDVSFSFPWVPQGTPFQCNVWQQLCKIGRGKTRQYGELAQDLQSGARAIGNACRKNPIPVIIPCHRVVCRNNLGGFSGETRGEMIRIKTWLLNHEQTDSRRYC